VPGGAETGDHFGYYVTVLDNNKDGFADVTVGVPNEDGTEGAITYLKGGPEGVRPTTGPITGSIMVGPGTFGVAGKKAGLGRRLGR
jgi:hypothetical protein